MNKQTALPVILLTFLTAVITSFGAWQVQAGNYVTRNEEQANLGAALEHSPYTQDKAYIQSQLMENHEALIRIETRLDTIEKEQAAMLVLVKELQVRK